jgi:hypothetical protein
MITMVNRLTLVLSQANRFLAFATEKDRGLCAPASRCQIVSLGYQRGRLPRFRAGRRPGSLCYHQRQRRRHAHSFTLLLELVRIWLGASGISGPAQRSRNVVERFCNDAASEFCQSASNISMPNHNHALDSFNTTPQSRLYDLTHNVALAFL